MNNVFPRGFPISVIKRAEKVNGFVFCGQGNVKCEMKIKKLKCFSTSGSFFTIFCWKFARTDD